MLVNMQNTSHTINNNSIKQSLSIPPRTTIDLSQPDSLSIVIPLYNEEESLPPLLAAITQEAPQIAGDN